MKLDGFHPFKFKYWNIFNTKNKTKLFLDVTFSLKITDLGIHDPVFEWLWVIF